MKTSAYAKRDKSTFDLLQFFSKLVWSGVQRTSSHEASLL
jgi:hypothetical protein